MRIKIIFGALSSFHQFDINDKNDLLQAIFLKLFKDDMSRIKRWNQRAKFSTYLYMITTNSALDYLDSKHFKRRLLSNSDIDAAQKSYPKSETLFLLQNKKLNRLVFS